MKILDACGKLLLLCVPPYNRTLYRLCKRYCDRYNAENNSDLCTNGELRFMQRMLPSCQTVFDVGANTGDWTARALRINPRLRVHCFEPSRTTYQRLVARGLPDSVICNGFGLSSAPGTRMLHVFSAGAGMNSLYRREGLEDAHGLSPQENTEAVEVDTLDRYCNERNILSIDFLKLDVEGHELEVCKGALGMLGTGRIKFVQFEYGGCNIDARVLLKDLFLFFDQLDYALYKIYPDCLVEQTRYDQRLETFQYQNWVAVKHGVENQIR